MCGDSKVIPPETCDDGAKGGCNSTCIGQNPLYVCVGGSPTTPTNCTKLVQPF